MIDNFVIQNQNLKIENEELKDNLSTNGSAN